MLVSDTNNRQQSNRVLRSLRAFNDFLDRPVIVVTNVLLILCCIFICVEVLLRYILGISQAFLEEQSKSYMVWFVYLILGVLSKERSHVKMDVISRFLSSRSRDIAEIIFHLSIIVFCVIVGWGMVRTIGFYYHTGQTPSTQFALPEWTVRLVLPVGLLFLLLRNLELVIDGVLALMSKERSESSRGTS